MRKNLTKSEIIRVKSELRAVFSSPVVSKVETVLLRARPNGRPYSRLVCATTKRIKPAPVRNKAKRIVREFYRQNKEYITPGMDFAVILLPYEKQDELRRALHDALIQSSFMYGRKS